MNELKKIINDLQEMKIEYYIPQLKPLEFDSPHNALDNIQFPPNPIQETNRILIEQNEILRQQLKTLQRQNEELKQQAEENAKEANRNKLTGWITFGIGTVIAIVAFFV